MTRTRLLPGPVSGLAPVLPQTCTLLLLGSLPGRASLAAGRYYGHPRNQFWALMEGVIGESLVALDYDARLVRLGARGIGLWDVIGSARRASSLDGDIREAVTNPLRPMVEGLPHLRGIGCNGALSARVAMRALIDTDVPIVSLPSSSPAYTLPRPAKAEAWRALEAFILPLR
jgi:hypoxanthine-DNA glycosylase